MRTLPVLASLAAADSIWDAATRAQPLPQRKDYERNEYVVVHVADPHTLGLAVIEPMPIRDHWVMAVPRHEKRALDVLEYSSIRTYRHEYSKIQKRAPVLAHDDGSPPPSLGGASQCKPRQLTKRGQEAIDAVRAEFGIEDPLFGDQWHLFNGEIPGHDMNVVGAWRLGAFGDSTTVAIVDDGLDYTHPDFSRSFSLAGSFDFNKHRQEPTPELYDDWHGTRCAGEIAAGFNDACGVGIAPNASVAGIRILSGMLSTIDEARALNHEMHTNDIYSCSWGPSDDGQHMEGPPNLVRRSILNGVENGRNGLGSIYVQAAGNGAHRGDNCNYDGYTNSIYSITVAAVDIDNKHPFYGESCSANLVTTYSSNRDTKITSTDQVKLHKGKPQDACTNGHTGTSAAAPMAAGILALVLEQRPDLSWRDVQYVCREAAVPFEIADVEERGNWTEVHDGKFYHNDYGYGLLDAEAAVNVARKWVPVNPQTWFFSPVKDHRVSFNDIFEDTVEVSEEDVAGLKMLEHATVKLSYQFQKRGALQFTLASPNGHEVVLSEPRPRDNTGAEVTDWVFSSFAHWGEQAAGVWKLRVENKSGEDLPMGGVFKSWSLRLWGESTDPAFAKRYSEMWDEEYPQLTDHELEALGPAPSTTLHPTTPGAEPIAKPSATEEPPQEAEEPSVSEDQRPTKAPAHPEPTNDTDDMTTAPHGVLFFLLCGIVGILIIMVVVVPILLYTLKRRQESVAYDSIESGLLEDDMELDNVRDSFEISDDEPLRPTPQPLEHLEDGHDRDQNDSERTSFEN